MDVWIGALALVQDARRRQQDAVRDAYAAAPDAGSKEFLQND